MRNTTTLSTLVMAAIVAVFTVQSTFAQASGQQAQQPRYMPPQKVHQDSMIQPAGFQQEIEVPSILSGKQEPQPTQPPQQATQPAPPTTTQQPAFSPAIPTGETKPAMGNQMPQQIPMRTAAETQLPGSQLPGTQLPGVGLPKASPIPTPTAIQQPEATQVNPIAQVSNSGSGNSLRTQRISFGQTNQQEFSAPAQQEYSAGINTTTPRIIQQPRTQISQPGKSSTDGPKLRVTSTGPSSITIGKPARYEIQVENLEARSASSVIVGIDLPDWIEVTNVLPSIGSKEMTDGKEESLMVWQLPIVEANATEKMMIDVIPREPRPFDIDVEWTFKPIRGKATIEVTQPQLSIQISGPTEVQFGEKALYDVTVSNPGTGIAENVSVMLPEVLGGERAKLDNIAPQQQKKFQVELIARSAGALDLTTTVLADGNLKESDTREIIVRRAMLKVALQGPPMKYAGSVGTYNVTVSNQGDAMARDVIAAVALPPGVDFVSGIDNVEKIDGGIRWKVGMLSPGNERTYQLNCNMTVQGDISIDAATRGAGDLAAQANVVTRVEAVSDLVLKVADPKGPLPTGEKIEYEIRVKNRGTKSAKGVNIVMHFSEGVEPLEAEGIANTIAPGQVTFSPIAQIDPDQEVVLKIQASATLAGSHRFRAQLLCEEADTHEVAEGTTRFFGENSSADTAENESAGDGGQFKR